MRAFPSQPASAFSFKEILYGKEGGIARVTINRPGRYNAYSTSCLQELSRAFRDSAFDDAADHAYVGQVGVRVGSVACGGATQWLALVVGDKRAREMLFTNRQVPAR